MFVLRGVFLILMIIVFFSLQRDAKAQESRPYELTEITFTGNDQFSSGVLKDVIFSKETPFWFWKFLNSFTSWGKEAVMFDSLLIESDLKALKEYYTSNGFFEFSAIAEYQLDSLSFEATLHFTITEGAPATMKLVDLTGLKTVHPNILSEIQKVLTIDSTSRFSQFLVKQNIDNILTILENNGFMMVKYDSTEVFRDTAHNKANLLIHFSPGKQYEFSNIIIEKKGEGAESVDDELLKDIVGIKPGESYNLERIRLSQVRLYRTGLFNSVLLGPKIEDTLGTTVPLLINGSIGLLNEFSPEILMNNQQSTFNIGLGGSFYRKNFFGQARRLTLQGSAGLRDLFNTNFTNLIKGLSLRDTTVFGFLEGVTKIEQPYVFNKPIFGTLEGYYRITKDILSNKRNFGAKLSFEFELPRYTFVNFLTAYYNFDVVDEIYPRAGNDITITESLSILGAELKSVKTDDPVFPTSGFNISFLFEEANLMSLLFSKLLGFNFDGALFYKTSATIGTYFNLDQKKSLISALKFKAGYIQAYDGDELQIPSIRKFTVGGSNSLRGWKARELAPQETAQILGQTVLIPGGTFLLETSIELRKKVTNEIGVVLFSDFGNTWLGYSQFTFSSIAIGTGIGVRYYTAFAPFRIDFGMKAIDPDDRRSFMKKSFFSEVFEFQFGIGEAF